MLAARIGDLTVHGGVIVAGCPTVIIGEVGMGNPMPVVFVPDGSLKVGNAIIIKGGPAFQAKVLADLAAIGATPTGAKLLKSINDSGKTVTIQPTTGGNSTSYGPGDRFIGAGGKPGAGTDATVNYNATNTTIGTQPWETRPPAIGLAHELIHADQANHGTTTPGRTNNDNVPDPANPGRIAQTNTREVETTGVPPNDNRDINENKIRDEWNPKQPRRQWY
jgi:type VI secretion system secreted protein VgrG